MLAVLMPSVFAPSALAQLNGVYTIGSGGNYATFSAAVTALSTSGVSGPVTFNVLAGTYSEQIAIPAISGASLTNTITFDGGAGNAATRVLTFSATTTYSPTLTLNGADYIRIKNLSIRSTNTLYGQAVLFTNSADYNEISNCTLEVTTGSTSAAIIPLYAGTTSSYSSTGDYGNFNVIKDNSIIGGYYGIRWNGSSSTDYSIAQGNQFINNSITGWYYYGMYMWYPGGALVIRGNTAIQRSTGTFTSTAGYAYYVYYPNNGLEVSYNYGWTRTSPFYIFRANNYYASSSNRARIFNNMGIADNTSSTVYGLYVSYPRFTDVVYNSVYLKTPSTSYGIYDYGETTTTYDKKFVNNSVYHEGNGTFYGLYNYYNGSYSQFDYNLWFRIGTGSTIFWWNYGSNSTSYSSLTMLQGATTGVHQNSKWGNPYFVSTTDLHSRSHVGYQAGTPFAGITNDYDGDSRNVLTPSIGADEYPAPPPEFDLAIAKVRLNYADNKFARIEGAATHAVNAVLQNTGLSPNPSSVTVVYKVGSAPTSAVDGVAQVFSPTWVGDKAAVTFAQPVTGAFPNPAVTVFARVFWASDQGAANNTASDTRKIDIVKVHGSENFNSMAAPSFSDLPGFLDYAWTVNNVNAGNTWRVQSGVGAMGSNALYYPGDVQPANDWIFTPAANLQAGSSYRIAFNIRSESGMPQTVEVAYGTAADPASMTTFATFSNFSNNAFLTAKQLAGNLDPYFNTPNFNGNYFIGFRVASGAGAGGVVIDDIVLDDNPSPPPKIGFGLPGEPLSTFIDNPAKKITLQANYKSPVVITRTYQVASTTNIYGSNGDFLWDVETSTPWISIAKSVPANTAQGYNFNPPRPRQFQDFTITINPAGLPPGVHNGQLVFYGILFNNDFPPPSNGLNATNQPLNITVELIVVNTGTKTGPAFEERTLTNLAPGSYNFTGPNTGNPIASVQVTSGFIPSMTIRMYPNQLPPNITRMMYVKRYWQITHTGTAWTANITFPYADQEAAMVLDRYQLRGVRQAVLRGAWEDPINGTTSTSDPATNSVKVFDLNQTNSGGNIALAQPYMYAKRGELPTSFGLEQNYPNPFNPSTTVSFAVAEERAVRIVVYNSLGMEVGELVNDVLPAGRYSVEFDASALPSGTYLYRMIAGDHVQTMQMVLSK